MVQRQPGGGLFLSRQQFNKIVAEAIDAMPGRYLKAMRNVVFVVENEPSLSQLKQMKLRGNQTLFGLYEGIPLTERGAGYNLVLPDKITIFKRPLETASHNLADLKRQVKQTVWHEIAHHFGLNHGRIEAILRRSRLPSKQQSYNKNMKPLLLDVRSEEEWNNEGHVAEALHWPLDKLSRGNLPKLDADRRILVYCRSGARAAMAVEILKNAGFNFARSLGSLRQAAEAGYHLVKPPDTSP